MPTPTRTARPLFLTLDPASLDRLAEAERAERDDAATRYAAHTAACGACAARAADPRAAPCRSETLLYWVRNADEARGATPYLLRDPATGRTLPAWDARAAKRLMHAGVTVLRTPAAPASFRPVNPPVWSHTVNPEYAFTCAHPGCELRVEIDPEWPSAELFANEQHAAEQPGHNPDWRDDDGCAPGER